MGYDTMAALAATALLAGFVDSIAGGGGLITVPALLLAGLDPAQAIATNKVQGSFAAASATFAFGRRGLIAWGSAWRFAAVSFLSGGVGALCVRFLPKSVLDGLIPLLLIGITGFFALSPRLRNEDAHARLTALTFGLTAPVAIGFYDGIFGPGAGSFYVLAFVTLLGYGVVRATAHTKLLNFSSNFGSLLLYAATGAVVWPLGLVMAAASFTGAQIGSRLAMRHGAKIIRPLLVAVSGLMALKLLLDPANPWHQAFASLFLTRKGPSALTFDRPTAISRHT